jgi:peroxiredoxin
MTVLAALMALVFWMGVPGRAFAATPGFELTNPRRPLPDVSFLDVNGRVMKLSQFRGRVVLLHLWATWCVSCVREMTALNDMETRLSAEGLTVLTVSIDSEGPKILRSYFEDRGYTLKPYADPKASLPIAFRMSGVPASLLIDKEGREMARHGGETAWRDPAVINFIRSYLR